MDSSSFDGLNFESSNRCKMSIEEKTELVYSLSNFSNEASEILQAWSRQEILEVLCAEMGKERKYTGLTKSKLIENLLKIVNEKKSQFGPDGDKPQSSSDICQSTPKRQRKSDHPSRLNAAENLVTNHNNDLDNIVHCKNSACKAKLSYGATFCKRCSCCICTQYDDNKDPSLWLVCSSEPPFPSEACGMSCHLECAIKHERSGIGKDMKDARLDGAFYCASCGKANDILGSWKKQLNIARETRRVDILGYRLSLSRKLLGYTKRYRKMHKIVEEAVTKLEADVGPLTGIPVKKARGIVNRLSSAPEVQRLCALALESLDLMHSDSVSDLPSATALQGYNMMASEQIRFEDVGSSSLVVVLGPRDSATGQNFEGYTLWHRKANDVDYPEEPTCNLCPLTTRFLLSNLTPDTDYLLKIVSLNNDKESGTREVHFRTSRAASEVISPDSKSLEVGRSHSPATNWSSLSNPSSVEDETNNILPCSNEEENREENHVGYSKNTSKIASANVTQSFINHRGESQREITGDTASLLVEDPSTGKLQSVPGTDSNLDRKYSPMCQMVEETSIDDGSNIPAKTGLECVPFVGNSEAGLPVTPYKLENMKDAVKRNGKSALSSKDLDSGSGKEEEPLARSSSKKRSAEKRDDECAGIGHKEFEYYVKVIRWLECEGHIETAFRQKFLTWYSLRASQQEVRVVKVFVDTFIEDPASLADQLVDTFSEVISNKRSCIVPAGFCMKLWH